MSIRWYTGHMTAARQEAAETMGKIDLVIEVLDARVPRASCNPIFEGLRRQSRRPALKLLNKADAADPEQTPRWLQHYNRQEGMTALAVCAKDARDVRRIPRACQALLPQRGTAARPLRMMILGIPNVGKSTLMNALLRRHVAHVGDEPAITRKQMLHQLGAGMTLIDTPGVLWPEVTQETALVLAASHSIGRAAYDDEVVALALARRLLDMYPGLLRQRWGDLPDDCDPVGLLQAVSLQRNLVKRGGLPDIAKSAQALLNDFRSGALGRITLERL
jgi:ribosome biogenesis GTPase A